VNMYLYWDPDTGRSYSTFTASVGIQCIYKTKYY